jgi:hypothetical protein
MLLETFALSPNENIVFSLVKLPIKVMILNNAKPLLKTIILN